jgi:hypothetical protein
MALAEGLKARPLAGGEDDADERCPGGVHGARIIPARRRFNFRRGRFDIRPPP